MPTSRGMIFSDHSILATLSGTKVVTRRVVRNSTRFPNAEQQGMPAAHCPYGVPGDQLWVRESYKVVMVGQERHTARIYYKADGATHDLFVPEDRRERLRVSRYGQWHQARYMPRWMARLHATVVDVGVERLHAMVPHPKDFEEEGVPGGVRDFQIGWNELNANRGFAWARDPWVFVVRYQLDRVNSLLHPEVNVA